MKWNEVTKLDVHGSRIAIKDAMIMLDPDADTPEWPSVEVEPGRYVVEIHLPESWYCTRVRIRAEGSSPSLGEEIGRVDVDHGKAAVLDYDSFIAAVRADPEAYEDWTEGELDDELAMNFSGEIAFTDSALVYTTAGEGDGSYPAYRLVENGDTVGLECHFE